MNIFDATMLAENGEADEDTMTEAWQLLIDTGVVWQLQGTFGRAAVQLIEAGVCTGTIPGRAS